MLTVHHLGVSQSDRVVWLCEELEIPYELRCYQRDPVTLLAPPEYKALHPSKSAPVITDGDLILGESAAIIEYVLAKYGECRLTLSPEHPEFGSYLYWFHFSAGSMMPSAQLDFAFSLLPRVEHNETLISMRGRYDLGLEQAERRLGEAQYFAGSEFTAADIMMLFPLSTMRCIYNPRDLSPYPNIRRYLRQIGERPAYQRAVAKADPTLQSVLV